MNDNAPATWSQLRLGAELKIVKLTPGGSKVTHYPGAVIDLEAFPPWIAARARWVNHEVGLDGLRFAPGDELHEFFSPVDWFNVFSIFSPEGVLRGWYANVTYPTKIDFGTAPPTLFWRDLYVDVIALPNGELIVRDEDELEASGLASADSDLYAQILKTRDDLIALARARAFPFHER